jgi:predicted metalloprotease with PDZ domain
MKLFLGIIISLTTFLSWSMEIIYSVSMSKPQNHYFEVEMALSSINQKSLVVKLPVWAPGSYLVREFSKNINLVKAFDDKGKEIKVEKLAKNAWQINTSGIKSLKVRYEVYSFELSVRTSFLDLTHGYISGSGIFMYVDNCKDTKGILKIFPFETFKKINTALPIAPLELQGNAYQAFEFKNYDQLVDCPIEIGNQDVFEFMAAGVKHTVAMYGDANYSVPVLKMDMAKIIASATSVFGFNPNKNYLFIIHNVVNGQGGLEHINSTTLSVNRWTYSGPEYIGFLNLVAHEYFHLWNVKRIRPIELGPFDYDKEVYTSLLWVMEGFTSYYDELIMLRTGYYTQAEFLTKIQSLINYAEGSVGSRIQPVAHASFDAWIKSYRPNENSYNTTMSYYSRGAVLAAVIDAIIINKYNGTKCLDHFMQHLYKTYYEKQNRGFTEAEFKNELAAFTGEDMNDFFKRYVEGTEIIPFATYFSKIGVDVKQNALTKPSFGATVQNSDGKVIVKSIRVGSAAEDAGLSVNDEVIACNGYRVDQAMFDAMMNGLALNEEAEVLLSRDEILFSLRVKITNYTRPQFFMTPTNNPSENLKFNYWLR